MTKPHQKTKEYEIVSELNELYREVGSIHKKIESLMNKISHMATEKECESRSNILLTMKDVVRKEDKWIYLSEDKIFEYIDDKGFIEIDDWK